MLRPLLKIWDWGLIFGRAVKTIFSPGVRSPWVQAKFRICNWTLVICKLLKIHSIDLHCKKQPQHLSGQWNSDFLKWFFINIIHSLEIRPVAVVYFANQENAWFEFFFKKWNYSLFFELPCDNYWLQIIVQTWIHISYHRLESRGFSQP